MGRGLVRLEYSMTRRWEEMDQMDPTQKALTRGELKLARHLWPNLAQPMKIDFEAVAKELTDVSAGSMLTEFGRLVKKGIFQRVSPGVYQREGNSKVQLRIYSRSRTEGYRLIEIDLETSAPETAQATQEIATTQVEETIPAEKMVAQSVAPDSTESRIPVLDGRLEATIVAIKLKIKHLQYKLKVLEEAREITVSTLNDLDQAPAA